MEFHEEWLSMAGEITEFFKFLPPADTISCSCLEEDAGAKGIKVLSSKYKIRY